MSEKVNETLYEYRSFLNTKGLASIEVNVTRWVNGKGFTSISGSITLNDCSRQVHLNFDSEERKYPRPDWDFDEGGEGFEDRIAKLDKLINTLNAMRDAMYLAKQRNDEHLASLPPLPEES